MLLLPALLLLLTLLPLFPANAGDGRIEINQARALAGGVSASDTPGFPVTISGPGSYLLTSDLVVPANLSGIFGVNDAVDITLDLNGFSISGPVTCSGTPLSCSASGPVPGIRFFGGENVEIRNGTIRGFAGDGVQVLGAVANCSAQGLRVTENGGDGIKMGTVGENARIDGNVVTHNLEIGIDADNNSKVSNNVVSSNGGDQLHIESGTYAEGNVLSGTTALDTGLSTGSAVSGYRNNLIRGSVIGNGVDMGGNLCDGSTTCP